MELDPEVDAGSGQPLVGAAFDTLDDPFAEATLGLLERQDADPASRHPGAAAL